MPRPLRDQVLARPARPLGHGLRQGRRLAAAGRGGPLRRRRQVLYLQGELDVTRRGTIRIRPAFPEGIRFWVDDVAAPIGTREFTTHVTPGRHAVTLRVEIRRTDRTARSGSRLTSRRGSTAEFTVVGGK